MFSTQLNVLAQENYIMRNGVITLKEYICNTVQGRKILIVLAISIVSQSGVSRLGSPVDVELGTVSLPADHTVQQANRHMSHHPVENMPPGTISQPQKMLTSSS